MFDNESRQHLPIDDVAVDDMPADDAVAGVVPLGDVDAGVVGRVVGAARVVAGAQAVLLAAVWDVAEAVSDGDGVGEFAADEVRAALSLTRRAAESLVTLAWQVRVRLPELWDAL